MEQELSEHRSPLYPFRAPCSLVHRAQLGCVDDDGTSSLTYVHTSMRGPGAARHHLRNAANTEVDPEYRNL
ncbi:MAG: hypothetical protein JWO59_1530 [Chloroflexi bacterium]|nr:hypothetical protein [Chloroflexota bacterium]